MPNFVSQLSKKMAQSFEPKCFASAHPLRVVPLGVVALAPLALAEHQILGRGVCGVWCVVCGALYVVCCVWCVVCGVLCVVRGVNFSHPTMNYCSVAPFSRPLRLSPCLFLAGAPPTSSWTRQPRPAPRASRSVSWRHLAG